VVRRYEAPGSAPFFPLFSGGFVQVLADSGYRSGVHQLISLFGHIVDVLIDEMMQRRGNEPQFAEGRLRIVT
jgi:hypothetical protein